ncbi:hypothetical protein Plim_1237 [Planctopirus limnophila DSM 3776]|uniref:Uncharacterized protein n=1 Tax=Planctopirus limnophila (strain ATCC 43296 / DSM 3776 / IFAM 1008 / Mu 290) TaxID=521674 RepID=D5SUL9_PLAL2|nr:hypothetical protein Plim_1237 [Planctopirus limnophila DSM 3776]
MFKVIMMRRNVTGAVILANGDDQVADEDIRPLPPRREGMLAQSCKHGTQSKAESSDAYHSLNIEFKIWPSQPFLLQH